MGESHLTRTEVGEPMVACVLVTWNNWKHTQRCLAALAQQDFGNLLVIVVDNGSTDGSLHQLRSAYPAVICIENGYNVGFAKACNIGARRGIESGAEFLWFLNNDTEARPDTVGKLVAKAGSDAIVGIVGAVLLYMHDSAKVQAWGGGEINLWSGFNHHFAARSRFGRNAYITFASALVRRQTFEDLGGLWEGVFLYFEDSDFSLRATAAGWGLAVADDTAILHAESGSVDRRCRNPLLERIQTTSGILFLQRHGPVPAISVAIFVCLRVVKRVVLWDWPALRGVLRGVGDWWRGRITPFRLGA